MQPLDPHEKHVLQTLEQQLSEDDPRLARKLRTLSTSPLGRLAPGRWPPRVFLVIGVALFAIGVILDVGSSVMGGLVAIGLWWLRTLR